ncbi:MAG: hypothetical protein AB8G99_05375 [Planctomycetaceae bacterium]
MIQLAAVLLLLVPQSSRPKATSFSFEIITPRGTGSRVAAQEWGRVFAQLGHTVRIRQQTTADGAGPAEPVSQTETATSRRIKAIGVLDPNGRVHFGDKTFRASDRAGLGQWISELKQYGTQGNPAGKPLWGLTRQQFDGIFVPLAKPLQTELKGMSVEVAVASIKLPRDLPIKWTPEAKQVAGKAGAVDRELQLYGRGASLAILLNDIGLGFLPERQPNGSLALLITKQAKEPLWPIGWQPTLSLAKTIPNFYKRIDVSLPKVKLTRVFSAVSSSTKIPIFVDQYHIKAKGQQFEQMMVEVKPTKMSWFAVMRKVTVRNRLNFDIRIDELGKPFIWVSTTEVIQRRKDRFRKQ